MPERFLGAEAVDHVQMRADREEAVGERPLDRAPVIGQQQIGPFRAQRAAKGAQIGKTEPRLLRRRDRPQAHAALDQSGGTPVPVRQHDHMLECRPEAAA